MQLPIILIETQTLGEAWEKAVEAVWTRGVKAPHHYEEELSKEATVIINVTKPLQEPRFSRKDAMCVTMFMTGPDKKKPYREKQYVRDLLDGDMDHRVLEGIESYTYHERLRAWGMKQPKHEELLSDQDVTYMELIDPQTGNVIPMNEGIDQMEMLIQKAKEEPISRKLQVTTWQPHKDLLISGAPCLQRIWIRILDGKSMVMEVHFRSRDLYKAWGANCLGLTEVGKWIADRLELEFVQYVDISNSLHIYASDFQQVARHFETIANRESSKNIQ